MIRSSSRLRRFLIKLAFLAGLLAVFLFLLDSIIMPLYVQQGNTTRVPNVTGLPLQEALQTLENTGLEGKEAEIRLDRRYPVGTVAAQVPPPNSEVKFGRGVYLTVSGGEPQVVVPSLRGRSIRDASLTLEGAGLTLGSITYQVSTAFPENTVIEQSIMEGTKVSSSTLVHVTVSQGPSADRVPVPSVIRRTLTEAERIILQSGLVVGKVTYQPSPDLLPNTVIDQVPREGSFLSLGKAVDLYVASRPEERIGLEHE